MVRIGYVVTDETVYHIRKCSQVAQKEYMIRADWVEKMILWELCKKLKFDNADKWYKYKPKTVLENNKILWDFEI